MMFEEQHSFCCAALFLYAYDIPQQLNPYRALLEFEYGIRCELERNAKGRTLHLTKIKNDDSDDTPTISTDTVSTVMT